MMFDDKTNDLYLKQGMTQEDRQNSANQTPGANPEDIFQAENGMFKDNLGEYRDKNGIKYMPDGIPALTFPNTKGWEQPTHWAHPKGSGLNPEDYPELKSSFYEDPETKLRVRKPAAWDLPGAVNFAQVGGGAGVVTGPETGSGTGMWELSNNQTGDLNGVQRPQNGTPYSQAQQQDKNPNPQSEQPQKPQVRPTSPIWKKFKRAYEIGDELDKDPRYRGSNNVGDAMRHAEWMRRVTQEVGPGTVQAMGTLHEIINLFQLESIPEMLMDYHNNRVGIDAGVDGKNISPDKLQTKP